MNEIRHPENLTQCGRNVPFPFSIPLQDTVLHCLKPLRILPHKRITCLAHYQGRTVVAKIFYDKHKGYSHKKREEKGIMALIKAGISTPELLYAGKTAVKKIHVLIFEYRDKALSFQLAWQACQPEQKEALLTLLIEFVAQCHQRGIYQNDIHLDNFLIEDNKLLAIDGDKIRFLPLTKALLLRQSVQNLGMLIAQFDRKEDGLLLQGFSYYVQCRQWQHTAILHQRLLEKIKKSRNIRKVQYLKKIFRECSHFAAINRWKERLIFSRGSEQKFLPIFMAPDAVLHRENLLKNGNTCTVGKVRVQENEIVIKRYNIKNCWHALRRCLQPTRAAISWRNAHYLQMAGVQTPTPIALIEKRFGFLRGRAYFIADYVNGPGLDDYINQKKQHGQDWKTLAADVILLLADLYSLQLWHGDLKASNILVVNDKPILIDLDSMKQFNKKCKRFQINWQRDMQRFLKNWDGDNETTLYFQTLLQEKGLLV